MPWPPQTLGEVGTLAGAGLHMAGQAPLRMPGLALDAFRPLGAHLPAAPERLRQYVDGQLLIAAQATSPRANALYGAAALDMPRRGVAHVRGGIGKLAETLVNAVRRHGGQVLFRQRATRVSATGGAKVVETDKNRRFEADAVVFNLPPWDAAALLGQAAPTRMRKGGAACRRLGRVHGLRRPGREQPAQPIFRCTTRPWSGSRSAKGTAFFSRSACPTMPPGARRASAR